LLKIGSKQGDLIFDPFMGVGSTGVAALTMQRRFLGFEKEAAYVLASVPRLELASGKKAVLISESSTSDVALAVREERMVQSPHEFQLAA
jgi:DNA modification methylase